MQIKGENPQLSTVSSDWEHLEQTSSKRDKTNRHACARTNTGSEFHSVFRQGTSFLVTRDLIHVRE